MSSGNIPCHETAGSSAAAPAKALRRAAREAAQATAYAALSPEEKKKADDHMATWRAGAVDICDYHAPPFCGF